MNKVVAAVNYEGRLLIFTEDGTVYSLQPRYGGVGVPTGWMIEKQNVKVPTLPT